MPFLLQPFHVMLLVLSELVRKEQEKRIEFLLLENQILRETIGGNRVLLTDDHRRPPTTTDDQRRRLAVKRKALGRQELKKLSAVAQADTILRWHRELIEKPERRSNSRRAAGRPRIDQEIAGLVLRMARENESWGYKRIQGQLSNVGFRIGKTSVANILKAHGIEPAPTRRQTPSWATFFNSHWDILQEAGRNAITLCFSKLIAYVSMPVSYDNAVVVDTALENGIAAPSLVILTLPIRHIAESPTQSSRGPPVVAPPAIFHHNSRSAA